MFPHRGLAKVKFKSRPEGNHVLRNAIVVDPQWHIRIRVSVIRFRLEPLSAAVRADGGLVDAGLEKLRSLSGCRLRY